MDASDECRADMTCHWEDTDSAIQEMFSNVRRPSSLSFHSFHSSNSPHSLLHHAPAYICLIGSQPIRDKAKLIP